MSDPRFVVVAEMIDEDELQVAILVRFGHTGEFPLPPGERAGYVRGAGVLQVTLNRRRSYSALNSGQCPHLFRARPSAVRRSKIEQLERYGVLRWNVGDRDDSDILCVEGRFFLHGAVDEHADPVRAG